MNYKKEGTIVVIITIIALVAIILFNQFEKPLLSPNLEEEIAKARINPTDNCPPPDFIVCAKFISPADASCQLLKEKCALCGGSGYDPYTCQKIHSKMTDYLINYIHSGCYSCYAAEPGQPHYDLFKELSTCCDAKTSEN